MTLANARRAAEHGQRAVQHLRMFIRAVRIAEAQGVPCVSAADLQYLASQAWANAKLAAHYALAEEVAA